MASIKEGPATEGRAVVHFGGEPGSYSKNHRKPQGTPSGAHSFHLPRVAVSRLGTGYLVQMLNAPWGWQNLDKECLNERAAAFYADKLRAKLRAHNQREIVRKARKEDARRRERAQRLAERTIEKIAGGPPPLDLKKGGAA